MTNRLFRHYNKVKYWLRVKHWRGRNIHSPFMFMVVREAILKRRKNIHRIDSTLMTFLMRRGIQRKHALLICSIYTQLGLRGYTYDTAYHPHTDLQVTPADISVTDCLSLITSIESDLTQSDCKCLVLFRLYQSKSKHRLWKQIIEQYDAVTVDLYNVGFIFFDKKLKKQFYKMKI